MVDSGLHRATVRIYRTAVSRSSPSAPISRESGSAAKNMILPITMDAINIIITEQVKVLLALLWSSLPSATEIGAEAPTAMRSEIEKLINTRGIAILIAAKALSPKV